MQKNIEYYATCYNIGHVPQRYLGLRHYHLEFIFKISNVIYKYILVEDRTNIQISLFSDNIAFIPLNEEYI